MSDDLNARVLPRELGHELLVGGLLGGIAEDHERDPLGRRLGRARGRPQDDGRQEQADDRALMRRQRPPARSPSAAAQNARCIRTRSSSTGSIITTAPAMRSGQLVASSCWSTRRPSASV